MSEISTEMVFAAIKTAVEVGVIQSRYLSTDDYLAYVENWKTIIQSALDQRSVCSDEMAASEAYFEIAELLSTPYGGSVINSVKELIAKSQ